MTSLRRVFAVLWLGVPMTASATSWPISISSNGRNFVDAAGSPFLVVGDTAHHLISNVPTTGYATYLTNRKGYGFNVVNFWGSCAHGLNNTGAAVDGTYPFTTGTNPSTYDLAVPNNAYWAKVDAFINQAAADGLTVMFLPVSVADYLSAFRNNGNTKVYNFGAFIGARYKSFPNIIYQDGNDFQSWQTSSDMALVKAFMDGVLSADPTHIHGIQLNYLDSYSNQASSTLSAELKSDFVYTYNETYDYMLKAYNSTPTLPTYLGESNYEGANHAMSTPANQFILREQMWYAMTSGGAGHVWGNASVNHFDNSYPASLNTPATGEVVHLPNLFQQFSWWNLVPDQAHAVITGGYGTPAPNNTNLYNATYATTAALANGTLAITYTPAAHTLTAALSSFSGPVRARWYDPSNGAFSTISSSPFANTGTQNFTTPGTNHDGDHDWVLVLDTGAAGNPGDGGTGGTTTDAGAATDAGTASDAGGGAGGGPAFDAGPSSGSSNGLKGCGCQGEEGSCLLLLATVLAAAVFRRPRPAFG